MSVYILGWHYEYNPKWYAVDWIKVNQIKSNKALFIHILLCEIRYEGYSKLSTYLFKTEDTWYDKKAIIIRLKHAVATSS